MRDSFGGAFIINLILVFIVIFISFMAVTVSYAKSFRVKNQVINIIEQNQYSGTDDSNTNSLITKYLDSVAYKNLSNNVEKSCNKANGELLDNGVCIVTTNTGDGKYYKVITYVSIDFPFFGISLVVPISGETKIIYS